MTEYMREFELVVFCMMNWSAINGIAISSS